MLHPKPILAALLSASMVLASPAFGVSLGYDAFVAGSKVGVATIHIERRSDNYEIRGEARSVGWLRRITHWRSFFRSAGFFANGKPVVSNYQVTENSVGKNKQIVYANGQVLFTRNGDLRSPFRPPTDRDLLSALFLSNGCGQTRELHDGKDLWRLHIKRAQAVQSDEAAMYCEFDVVDENDERSVASVWLTRVDDLVVLERLELQGALKGTLQLTDQSLDD